MSRDIARISPFAPRRLADMPAIDGVRLAACEAGIRYRGRDDPMQDYFLINADYRS